MASKRVEPSPSFLLLTSSTNSPRSPPRINLNFAAGSPGEFEPATRGRSCRMIISQRSHENFWRRGDRMPAAFVKRTCFCYLKKTTDMTILISKCCFLNSNKEKVIWNTAESLLCITFQLNQSFRQFMFFMVIHSLKYNRLLVSSRFYSFICPHLLLSFFLLILNIDVTRGALGQKSTTNYFSDSILKIRIFILSIFYVEAYYANIYFPNIC